MVAPYTSLDAAIQQARAMGERFVSVRLLVNGGRVTIVAYRNSFDVTEEVAEGETREIEAMASILRKYGKKTGRGSRPYEILFFSGEVIPLFVHEHLANWLQEQAAIRETVPNDVVAVVEEGVAHAVEVAQQRAELDTLKVEEVRRLASQLKVVGAWRQRKPDLIEAIIAARQEALAAS
jgi:hypothetical protein